MSAETIKEIFDRYTQPEYKAILREPLDKKQLCEELVFYKGAWVGPGDSIGKKMQDMQSK